MKIFLLEKEEIVSLLIFIAVCKQMQLKYKTMQLFFWDEGLGA